MKLFMYCHIFKNSINFKSNVNILLSKNTLIRTFSSDKDVLTIRETSIKTCGSLYQKWKKIGKFPTVPNTDLTFKVNYFDTGQSSSLNTGSKQPIVVALHGAPGSCNDFSNLTTYLHKKGVRVIVPSFPDYTVLPPGIFRHSDEEKAQFVKDFLLALSISQVDLLVCHSSAIYPGLLLCLDEKLVKSLAMLNTATFTLKMPSIQWFKILKIMVRASENPFILKILEVIGPIIMKLARIPVRVDHFLDPLLSATVMVHGNILQSKEKFLKLSTSGFPILYAFSENDKLVGEKNSYELASLLGAKPSDICFINKNGNVERDGKETSISKFLVFENGSHYCFWKYADITNEAIFNFLSKQNR